MSRYYVTDPATGESGTRVWLEKFLNLFFLGLADEGEGHVSSHYDRLYSTTAPARELIYESLSIHRKTNPDAGTDYRSINEEPHPIGRHTYFRSGPPNPNESILCHKMDVEKIVRTLSKRERIVLGEKYCGGLENADIAVKFDVSERTIDRILSHSLDVIAKRLDR